MREDKKDKEGGERRREEELLHWPPRSPRATKFPGRTPAWRLRGTVTRIIIRFGSVSGAPLPFDPAKGPGYVFHCHILDHEGEGRP